MLRASIAGFWVKAACVYNGDMSRADARAAALVKHCGLGSSLPLGYVRMIRRFVRKKVRWTWFARAVRSRFLFFLTDVVSFSTTRMRNFFLEVVKCVCQYG